LPVLEEDPATHGEPKVSVFLSGLITARSEKERSKLNSKISTIGLGSLLGIVLIILLAFSSYCFRYFKCDFPSWLAAWLQWLVTCLWFEAKLHLITIAFGAGLGWRCG